MTLTMIGASSSGNSSSQIFELLKMTNTEALRLVYNLCLDMKKDFYSNNIIENDGALIRERIGGFSLANSLWVEKSLPLNEKALLTLIEKSNSDIFKVEFENSLETTEKFIQYILENTDGRIQLNEFSFDQKATLAFINTIYLKDIWGASDLSFTNETMAFKNFDQTNVMTNFLMGAYQEGQMIVTENYNHFYTTTQNGYKLKFIVPQGNKTIEDVFTQDSIEEVNQNKDYHALNKDMSIKYYTRCLFPKFQVDFDEDITKILNTLGIKDIFNRDIADFSALTSDKSYLSGVRHIVDLTVDEHGIDGAAATIAANFTAPEKTYQIVYKDFLVDQSFGFVITDQNDIQIFSGVIKNI